MSSTDIKISPQKVKEGYSLYEQILSSCSGALLTSILVTPLDVVKIRLQVQEKSFASQECFLYYNGLSDHLCLCVNKDNHKIECPWYNRPGKFNGTGDAFVKIVRNEGLLSLWSGLPHTLVISVPATVLYFTMYEQLRDTGYIFFETDHTTFWIPMLSGIFARTLTVTTISPLEFIRTKAQSANITYSEMGKNVLNLVQHRGIFSLWRGLGPSLLRDVPFSGIYWSLLEYFKKRYSSGSEPNMLHTFLSGATAGSIAAAVTIPFDVVKTHRQIELGEVDILKKPTRVTTLQIIKELYKRRGISSLFAGLTPRLIKIAPSCAIMITSYEMGKSYFKRKKLEMEITKTI